MVQQQRLGETNPLPLGQVESLVGAVARCPGPRRRDEDGRVGERAAKSSTIGMDHRADVNRSRLPSLAERGPRGVERRSGRIDLHRSARWVARVMVSCAPQGTCCSRCRRTASNAGSGSSREPVYRDHGLAVGRGCCWLRPCPCIEPDDVTAGRVHNRRRSSRRRSVDAVETPPSSRSGPLVSTSGAGPHTKPSTATLPRRRGDGQQPGHHHERVGTTRPTCPSAAHGRGTYLD